MEMTGSMQRKVFRKKKKRQPEQQGFLEDSESDSDVTVVVKQRRSSHSCCRKYLGHKATQACIALSIFVALICFVGYLGFAKCGFFLVVEEECKTAACFIRAGEMVQMMNLTADPCEDFYTRTCGSFIKNHPRPPDKGRWTQFSLLSERWTDRLQAELSEVNTNLGGKESSALKSMFQFHQLCNNASKINDDGFTSVVEFLKLYGFSNAVWLNDWSSKAPWNINEALVLAQRYDLDTFFSTSVDRDSKDSNNILEIGHTGLTLSDETQYYGDHADTYRAAFLDYSTSLISLFSDAEVSLVKRKMESVYELEKAMAQAFQTKEYMADESKAYHKMTVEQLNDLIGNKLNLSAVLGELAGLKRSSNIVVYTPDYVRNLSIILKNTEDDTLGHYFHWRTLDKFVGYMPDSARQAALRLNQALFGVNTLTPRWRSCVHKTSNQLKFALAARYLKGKFGADQREQAVKILNLIKKSFHRLLPNVTWMDAQTRAAAVKKLNSMNHMIGYPDWIFSAEQLDQYYAKLNVTGLGFFETRLATASFLKQKELDKLKVEPDPTEWDMGPMTVNAYYDPSKNCMVFPAAILSPPFFDPNAPLAFNLGSLGWVMGHELTHGFDSNGRKFDETGLLRNWWSEEATEEYEKRSGCIKNQYSQYSVDGIKIKGSVTLGENIADNGGLLLAWKALESEQQEGRGLGTLPGLNVTSQQLFYTAASQCWCSFYTAQTVRTSIASDVHTYPTYRVIGTFSNQKAFASSFRCLQVSPMNPEKRCALW